MRNDSTIEKERQAIGKDETISVGDNAAMSRYELRIGDEVAGALSYYRDQLGRRVLAHTALGEAYKGRRLGQRLVAGALEDARARQLPVVSLCPFVSAFIRRHPEYANVVAE
jgi:predicted GNAT family acetyltransferase